MSRNIIALFVIAAFVSLTGCASSTQVATATAVDVADTAPVAPAVTASEVIETEEIAIVENDVVVLDGRVIEFGDGVVEVELLDGRRVRVASLENGDIAWHVVGAGVVTGLWSAPLNARVAYGCGVGDEGAALSLPEDAARQLERDLEVTAPR